MADFDLVYVHNKETGAISRKAFGEVVHAEEDWYAYDGDAKRPVRVTEEGDIPQEVEYYFHSEDKQGRPVRASEPELPSSER